MAEKFPGIYRAICNENNINGGKYAQIRCYIPVLHCSDSNLSPEKDGVICSPANSFLFGADENTKEPVRAVLVPSINSLLWVFFEDADSTRPYYLTAFQNELSEVPDTNKQGQNGPQDPSKVYTFFHSWSGRQFIISDDEKTQRIELRGKDYPGSNGHNRILIDETPGKERILIECYNGSYINCDIPNAVLNLSFAGGIHMDTGGTGSSDGNGAPSSSSSSSAAGPISINSGGGLDIKSKSDLAIKSSASLSMKADMNSSLSGGVTTSIKSSGSLAMDAPIQLVQAAMACEGPKAAVYGTTILSGAEAEIKRNMNKLQDMMGSLTSGISSSISNVTNQVNSTLNNLSAGVGGSISGGLGGVMGGSIGGSVGIGANGITGSLGGNFSVGGN